MSDRPVTVGWRKGQDGTVDVEVFLSRKMLRAFKSSNRNGGYSFFDCMLSEIQDRLCKLNVVSVQNKSYKDLGS